MATSGPVRIRAAVATAPGQPFVIEDLDLEAPRADEVLVRIRAVGVCHTDLVFRDAGLVPLPAVFGHEGAGIVEEVGASVTGFRRGDRVAISFRSCGRCARCGRGDPAYCVDMPALNYAGTRPDGSTAISQKGAAIRGSFFGQSSFATHALTYERNLVRVPDDMPLELMGPLGCGVQTGAGAIMNALACPPGSSVLITGAGPVGLSAVMGARLQACGRVIVSEPHEARRSLALELGATDVLDPGDGLAADVRRLIPDGVDFAFDTTGSATVLAGCLASLASKGVLGLVGVAARGTPLPGDVNSLMTYGHTLRGIIEGDSDPPEFIPRLLDHYRKGEFPFDRMIATYPFEKINEAIAAQARGECVKVVLVMGESSGPLS